MTQNVECPCKIVAPHLFLVPVGPPASSTSVVALFSIHLLCTTGFVSGRKERGDNTSRILCQTPWSYMFGVWICCANAARPSVRGTDKQQTEDGEPDGPILAVKGRAQKSKRPQLHQCRHTPEARQIMVMGMGPSTKK